MRSFSGSFSMRGHYIRTLLRKHNVRYIITIVICFKSFCTFESYKTTLMKFKWIKISKTMYIIDMLLHKVTAKVSNV